MRNKLILLAGFTLLVGLAGATQAVQNASDHGSAVPTLASVSGRIVVYNVADLVGENADEVGQLIRSTVSPQVWDKTAVMRITPGEVTVRYSENCPANVAGAVQTLIDQQRQAKRMCVRIDYRIVVSDKLHGPLFTAAELAAADHAKEILSRSQIVVPNAQSATMVVGEADINLPTVVVTPIISADRKTVTLTIRNSVVDSGRLGELTSCSVADGQAAAISVNDPASHQWMVFTATAYKLQTVDLSPERHAK